MSNDMWPPVPPGDDDDEQAAAEFEAAALALKARWEDSDFENKLRRLGLYMEGMQIMPIPTPFGIKPAIAMGMTIGNVAWTDRVLDPETDSINDQFRVMEKETNEDEFLDTRRQIQEALARGEDPLDIIIGKNDEPGDDDADPE